MTPAGTSTSLTSRINGMKTHTHTHKFILDVRLEDVPVGVCVVIPFILDVRLLVDAPPEVTQDFSAFHSAVLALIFIARRIQPSISLVGRGVEFCVSTTESLSTKYLLLSIIIIIIIIIICFGGKLKIPSSCDCTEIRTHVPQRQKVSRLPTEPPGRPQ